MVETDVGWLAPVDPGPVGVYFGVPLTSIYEKPALTQENVPTPLVECAKALRQRKRVFYALYWKRHSNNGQI